MSEYDTAWLIYAGAWAVIVLGVWLLVRRSWYWFRDLLVLMVAVLLALPAPVTGFPGQYAPAVLVALVEGVFRTDGNPLIALGLLAGGAGFVLFATVVRVGIRLSGGHLPRSHSGAQFREKLR